MINAAIGTAEPYHVGSVDELAQKLAVGLWIVLPHQALGGYYDLHSYLGAVHDECTRLGIVERTIPIPRKDMTVIVNEDKLPTFEQITDSVRHLDRIRWLGQKLRPELPARVARGE
ncbi:hypothetical protein [Amycolatopsis solani]|uniref:hypothetical protein n=1 Tax=Amycolatopsis solani TaxID=3028615 RepID=UPI0025B14B07|nr:hypothetical protein [Amycolatopsis sp. MEP2-6]